MHSFAVFQEQKDRLAARTHGIPLARRFSQDAHAGTGTSLGMVRAYRMTIFDGMALFDRRPASIGMFRSCRPGQDARPLACLAPFGTRAGAAGECALTALEPCRPALRSAVCLPFSKLRLSPGILLIRSRTDPCFRWRLPAPLPDQPQRCVVPCAAPHPAP